MTNENFDVLFNFLGFGNPKGKIWFVGLEEAETWTSDSVNKKLGKYRKGFFPIRPGEIVTESQEYIEKNPGERYTQVYDWMSRLVVTLNSEDLDSSLLKKYRDQKLLTANSNEFQMNLYPLGKKNFNNKTFPKEYGELFGVNCFKDYLKHVRETRFTMLFNKWQEYKPQLTICFGKTAWWEFEQLFQLNSVIPDTDSSPYFKFYPNGIVLTYFFGRGHMSEDRIKEMVQILKSNSLV